MPANLKISNTNLLKTLPTSEELKALTPAIVNENEFDIAEMNLMAARGLPGAEALDIDGLLNRLDEIAADVERIIFLRENYDQFLQDPERYHNSQAYFCVVCMISILKTKYGIDYNPKWEHLTPSMEIPQEFGIQADDQFIHAVIDGPGGTCASLPVFFIAIGRRIGFPLKLVKAVSHFYMRWDDPVAEWLPPDAGPIEYSGEVFNIEASGPDVHCLSDEEYRTRWPIPIPDDCLVPGGYLRSLTPAEELSEFLAKRGRCLQDNGRLREAIEVYKAACRLAPHNIFRSRRCLRMMAQWRNTQRHRLPVLHHPVKKGTRPIQWPQWITINGRRMLVQFSQTSGNEGRTPTGIGGSVSHQNLQLPDGRQGRFIVPRYSPSKPMEAFWVRLTGNKYALVHREPKSASNPANHFLTGQPIVPAKQRAFAEQTSTTGLTAAELIQLNQAVDRLRQDQQERRSSSRFIPVSAVRRIPGQRTHFLKSYD